MAYASVIAHSAVIRGNLRGDTSLEILGRVEGDVGVTGDVALGPDAVVVGTVSGARVVIGGSVEGDVSGSEAVVIEDTGRVVGDLSAPRIGVSEGAHLQGSVRTSGSSSTPSRPAARATATESRSAASPPVDRARPVAATPAPAPVAASAPKLAAALPAKRVPPPPVITAPRPGVRARKKLARR
jgi:cytoskeletal protein CcmA (bactofilin family)